MDDQSKRNGIRHITMKEVIAILTKGDGEMRTIESLLIEKERLTNHLECGKDVLCFKELNWVRGKIKDINIKIKRCLN